MSVTDIHCGGQTESSVRVKAKITGASARLAVSAAGGGPLAAIQYFGPVVPDAKGIVDLTATGLDRFTKYQAAIEEDGTLQLDKTVECWTLPEEGGLASTAFAFYGCMGANTYSPPIGYSDAAKDVSNSPVFTEMARRMRQSDIDGRPALFHVCGGDGNYRNENVDDEDVYLTAFDDMFAQSNFQTLLSTAGWIYYRDDHDWLGNNTDSTGVGREANLAAYRRRVASHAPVEGVDRPVYYSFIVSRILHIVTDLRADRSPNSDPDGAAKTMMGAAQLAWFLDLLENFAETPADFIVWHNSTPWIAVDATIDDSWGQFITERNIIRDKIVAKGLEEQGVILSIDHHSFALDDGTNNVWGSWPVFHAGALDSTANIRGGPFSHGYHPGYNHFGWVEVDEYEAGIVLTLTGFIHKKVWRTFEVAYPRGFVRPGLHQDRTGTLAKVA